VDTVSTPMLLKLVQSGKFNPSELITHSKPPIIGSNSYSSLKGFTLEFKFSDMEKAYETFGAAAQHDALKVLIEM
jgi:alcohol dehydrogenase